MKERVSYGDKLHDYNLEPKNTINKSKAAIFIVLLVELTVTFQIIGDQFINGGSSLIAFEDWNFI